jgi:hypothetical protein
MTDPTPLQAAIETRAREYNKGLDRLQDLASESDSDETYDIAILLSEAVVLVRCLRRLTQGRTPAELHDAFGAPGDFGYDTAIGSALARAYRGE